MRIAWFRPTLPDTSHPLDDTASLVGELRASHAVDIVTEAEAHDFVWRHLLTPWDLCVYELDDTAAHQYAWAYLLNYPGVVMLRNTTIRGDAGAMLSREGRLADYLAGFQFGARESAPRPLRVPLLASRCVVVPHPLLQEDLQRSYPEACVRCAPIGVQGPDAMPATRDSSHPLKVATPGAGRSELITRAAERARAAGARIELVTDGSFRDGFESCDVVVSLAWPPSEAPLTPALAGMAAGRTVVTLEVEVTAEWPALDPQTWSTRGLAGNARPIAVTIDPRDEEHSLMLALRRLATDAPLRQQLGRAARDWWRTHATPAHSAAAWAGILEEAASTAPPARPRDWPQHLGTDGMELTRAILAEYGRTLDI